FTLVELLVTIGIIVILAAGGLSVYSTSQKRGRDVRRVEDMKAIQSAFEQYYVGNGSYDASCDTMAVDLQGGIPQDPQIPTGPGSYNIACTASSYCACANLEVPKGNATDYQGCDASDFTSAGDGYYYCVKNLQ